MISSPDDTWSEKEKKHQVLAPGRNVNEVFYFSANFPHYAQVSASRVVGEKFYLTMRGWGEEIYARSVRSPSRQRKSTGGEAGARALPVFPVSVRLALQLTEIAFSRVAMPPPATARARLIVTTLTARDAAVITSGDVCIFEYFGDSRRGRRLIATRK